MGNAQQQNNTQVLPKFNRHNYEITAAKVYQYVELNRNKKIQELQKLEAKLKEMFNTKQANSESIKQLGSECVTLLKFIKSSNIVLRNLNVLKEQSINIEESVNSRQPFSLELVPLVHTIVWSTTRLNLQQISEFNNLVIMYVDPQVLRNVEQSPSVDLELKNYFKDLLPNPLETQEYLEQFCKRNKIDTFELYSVWPAESHVILDFDAPKQYTNFSQQSQMNTVPPTE